MDESREVEQVVMCPYMGIQCHAVCPGWISEFNDCLFRLCLTQVAETFRQVAVYLDKHFGLADGMSQATLAKLRAVIDGTASDQQKEIVRGALGSFIASGVLEKAYSMSAQQIAALVSKVDDKISFAFDTLFEDD